MESSHRVTIVMYHYVRDLAHSRYPEIKGLDVALFKEQIDYLTTHYKLITMETLIEAVESRKALPSKAALLTFDDAYIDHFNVVFPVLSQRNIQGSFFPPAKAITENHLLDVNKIHFILASTSNKVGIIADINRLLNDHRNDYMLESNEYYYNKLATVSRFDSAEVNYIKRLLQAELPEKLRNVIADVLFKRYVGIPEESFSRELYMNIDQLKCMRKNGMHIGGHGYDHYWLGSLSKEKQTEEIVKSLDFLRYINGNNDVWTMCYPYGNYNQETFEVLGNSNCSLALTTELKVADLQVNHRYTLPRLDTNDLPKDKAAKPNDWYEKG